MKKIKVNATTCQICGKYADWDSSIGKANYIVCNRCYHTIANEVGFGSALRVIFTATKIREEIDNEQN